MRGFLFLTMAAVLAPACGGNVVVDGTGASATTTTPTGASTTTGTSTFPTTTGPCSPTCNVSITQGGPGPCGGPGLAAYDALRSCACVSGNPCSAACTADFCVEVAIEPTCADCLNANCGSNYQICTTN